MVQKYASNIVIIIIIIIIITSARAQEVLQSVVFVCWLVGSLVCSLMCSFVSSHLATSYNSRWAAGGTAVGGWPCAPGGAGAL